MLTMYKKKASGASYNHKDPMALRQPQRATTPKTFSSQIIADSDMKNQLEKIFFQKLFESFKGKDIWILSQEIEKFESYGFKKLKTLEKYWQKNPGLVPEEIAQESKKDSGYALKIRIPKKSNEKNTLPDFILIDGGKGQLSAVVKVFEENGWEYNLPDNSINVLNRHPELVEGSREDSSVALLPQNDEKIGFHKNNHQIILCSIAKREEEIFFPYESSPRLLPNTSEGSYLLQRLRDESHRFAVSFNRGSRIKTAFKSELDNIPGIGPAAKKKLLKTFGSVEGIKNASKENLILCVGEKIAQVLRKKI